MTKTCCVTGHRIFPAEKLEYIKQALRREIEQAVADGYTYFISGFADGVDLIFAAIVADLKKENAALRMEAALPYRSRHKKLVANKETLALLSACETIGVHNETYTPSCYMKRNRFMVEHSQRVIAVYDGRPKSGTLSTMRFAYDCERDVRLIEI